MKFDIVPIEEKHIEGFWHAVDSVARERKDLAFLEGPPIHTTKSFVQNNINDNWSHFVALSEDKIIGWCDITSLSNGSGNEEHCPDMLYEWNSESKYEQC